MGRNTFADFHALEEVLGFMPPTINAPVSRFSNAQSGKVIVEYGDVPSDSVPFPKTGIPQYDDEVPGVSFFVLRSPT